MHYKLKYLYPVFKSVFSSILKVLRRKKLHHFTWYLDVLGIKVLKSGCLVKAKRVEGSGK